MKVKHIAAALIANGSMPQQMQDAWPHLSLSQIHAALAYYYDHKQQIDAEIEDGDDRADALRATAPATPGRKKLRDMGLRP